MNNRNLIIGGLILVTAIIVVKSKSKNTFGKGDKSKDTLALQKLVNLAGDQDVTEDGMYSKELETVVEDYFDGTGIYNEKNKTLNRKYFETLNQNI